MKFCQLTQPLARNGFIEYNMKNMFLQKSFIKYGGQTIPRPFSEKSKLSLFLGQ